MVVGDITLKKSSKSIEMKVTEIIFHEDYGIDRPENNIAVMKVLNVFKIYSEKKVIFFRLIKQCHHGRNLSVVFH